MVRDFYVSDEAEQLSPTFRGTEDSVGPHELEEINKVELAAVRGLGVQKSRRTSTPSAVADDDDEGWASDGSDRPHASTSCSTENEKKSSKPPKQKHSSKPVGVVSRKGRRRNSMRKGMWGHAYLMKQQRRSSPGLEDSDGEEADDHEEEGDIRGRSSSEVPAHGSRSLRNLRIDTIIRGTRSREDSPSRSIRFADEVNNDDNRSGYNTPQSPNSHLHDGSVDEPNSLQRVNFELSGSPN